MKQTFIYSICALVIFSSCMSEKEKNEQIKKEVETQMKKYKEQQETNNSIQRSREDFRNFTQQQINNNRYERSKPGNRYAH